VSQIEGCGGIICRRRGLGCPLGVKTAEAGMAVMAAGGGALFFLLCSIQVIVGASSIQMKNSLISPFNLQSNVVTSISLSLLVQT
jgi:hypothetical protein